MIISMQNWQSSVYYWLTFFETPQAQGSEVGSFHDDGMKAILTLNKWSSRNWLHWHNLCNTISFATRTRSSQIRPLIAKSTFLFHAKFATTRGTYLKAAPLDLHCLSVLLGLKQWQKSFDVVWKKLYKPQYANWFVVRCLAQCSGQTYRRFLWNHPQAHGSESRGMCSLLTLIKQIKEFKLHLFAVDGKFRS